jgi:hypothetical protein
MVNHKPSIVYQTAGLSYKKGFSIKVNGVSEKNSSPRHFDCSYILYISSYRIVAMRRSVHSQLSSVETKRFHRTILQRRVGHGSYKLVTLSGIN